MVKRLVIASLATTTHTLHTGLSAIFGDGHIEWLKHHCVSMSFPIFLYIYIYFQILSMILHVPVRLLSSGSIWFM